ncbi:MAG: ATP-binding protein [Terracidiphilus sp.]|nr:ATP-binding protein [Terracidiphilus sp.]
MKAEDNPVVKAVDGGAARRADLRPFLRDDLLDMASDAMCVRSLSDGRIQYWNPAAEHLYGWSRDEAQQCDVFELLKTVFPVSRRAMEDALAINGRWNGQLVHRTRHGREVVVESHMAANRELDSVLEAGRDVTLQLKAEQALRETEKLASMGRVAGMIVHEINNPLAAIANLVYLLQAHPSLDEAARVYAAAAERELERVAQITRRTLSFYREPKQQADIPAAILLDEVLELQKSALQSAGIRVVREYSAAGAAQQFPAELRQVFLNLIVNAMQAMPRGGTLRLCVRQAVDTVTGLGGTSISVIDTGTGILLEDRKHLFEPFFSTKASLGTGLGLWISKGIMEKYGGRISYRCYRAGGSNFTCFRVFLPGASVQNRMGAAIQTDRPQTASHPIPVVERAACSFAH